MMRFDWSSGLTNLVRVSVFTSSTVEADRRSPAPWPAPGPFTNPEQPRLMSSAADGLRQIQALLQQAGRRRQVYSGVWVQ
jgi:hypothetical protein